MQCISVDGDCDELDAMRRVMQASAHLDTDLATVLARRAYTVRAAQLAQVEEASRHVVVYVGDVKLVISSIH
jgi:hypothetical protein